MCACRRPFERLSPIAFVAWGAALGGCSLVTSWDGLTPGGKRSSAAASSGASSSGHTHSGGGPSTGSAGQGAGGPGGAGGEGAAGGQGGSGACTPGQAYCGDDGLPGDPNTLYACNYPDTPTVLQVCAGGCDVRYPQHEDRCRCYTGGKYCGGDSLDGDPNNLYTCNADGTGTLYMSCPNGCMINSMNDDSCIP
jgi:hypothetical protein